MTSPATRWFFETFPPDVAQAILEGRPIRVHTAKVSVVRMGSEIGVVITTLPPDGRSKKWEQTNQKIRQILKNEMEQLPAKTKTALVAIARLMPEEKSIPLFQVETWFSMGDDGGILWEVPALMGLATIYLPDVVKAFERAREKILQEVRGT